MWKILFLGLGASVAVVRAQECPLACTTDAECTALTDAQLGEVFGVPAEALADAPADVKTYYSTHTFCGCVDKFCAKAPAMRPGEKCTDGATLKCGEKFCYKSSNEGGTLNADGCVSSVCTSTDKELLDGCACTANTDENDKLDQCHNTCVNGKCGQGEVGAGAGQIGSACTEDYSCDGWLQCFNLKCQDPWPELGEYCDDTHGPNCFGGSTCSSNKCSECTTDANCDGEGSVCSAHECFEKGFMPLGFPCEHNVQCHSGTCAEGKCLAATSGKALDAACDYWKAADAANPLKFTAAEFCNDGVCVGNSAVFSETAGIVSTPGTCKAWGSLEEGANCYACASPFMCMTQFPTCKPGLTCTYTPAAAGATDAEEMAAAAKATCKAKSKEGGACMSDNDCEGGENYWIHCIAKKCAKSYSVASGGDCTKTQWGEYGEDSACATNFCVRTRDADKKWVNTCKTRYSLADGTACENGDECKSGMCNQEWNQETQSSESKCYSGAADGTACWSNWDCSSGFCGVKGTAEMCGDELIGTDLCPPWYGESKCYAVVGQTCSGDCGHKASCDKCGTKKCVAHPALTDDFVLADHPIPPPEKVDACATAFIGLFAEFKVECDSDGGVSSECLYKVLTKIQTSTGGLSGLSADNKKRVVDSVCCKNCGRKGQSYTRFNYEQMMFDVNCKTGTITEVTSCNAGGDHYGYIEEQDCMDYEAPAKYSYATKPDLCLLVDCGAHGTCASGGSSCTCKDSYTGPYCGNPPGVPACLGVECENGGTCTDSTGKCACTAGYTGPICQFEKPVVAGSVALSAGIFPLLAAIVVAVALF